MPAGPLRERVTLQRFIGTPDAFGHTAGTWVTQFTTAAGIAYLRGGEAVTSARLQAVQPAIVTVRNAVATRGIEPGWRLVNARGGEVFNIRERPRESKDNRGFLEMLVESG
jgi:head-tail adaptor